MDNAPKIEEEKTPEEIRTEVLESIKLFEHDILFLVENINRAKASIAELDAGELENTKSYLEKAFLDKKNGKFTEIHGPATADTLLLKEISKISGHFGSAEGDLNLYKK